MLTMKEILRLTASDGCAPEQEEVMPADKDRDAFEAHVRSLPHWPKSPEGWHFERMTTGSYCNNRLQDMWDGWQAGRATVALPELQRRYTPEELLDVAENTLIPTDMHKRAALMGLIAALGDPDKIYTSPGNSAAPLTPASASWRIEDNPAWQAGRKSAEGDLEFWEKVCYPEGMTAQDVKNELADFNFLMDNVPKVYCAITGDTLSKPMYHAATVIAAYEDDLERLIENAMEDHAEAAGPVSTSGQMKLVGWLEADPTAAALPPEEVIGSMMFSSRVTFNPTYTGHAANPHWPLYTLATASAIGESSK